MKPTAKQSSKKRAFTPLERKLHPLGGVKNTKRGLVSKPHPSFLTGFTIVELLTVMSIIIILIGLLVPALNRVRRFARDVRQHNQFHSIGVALGMFNAEFEEYPDSAAWDEDDAPYCGAMKLAEAMVGLDLLGFHRNSRFRSNGLDGNDNLLYPFDPGLINRSARRGPYLQLENANAHRLGDLYTGTGGFEPNSLLVLCDVYRCVPNLNTDPDAENRIGLPILYYRADTSNIEHSETAADAGNSIYNYLDNDTLVGLYMPWDPNVTHPLFTNPAEFFYESTRNGNITTTDAPYRADSFILISAGHDGLYGTRDDIFNFGR